MLHTSLCSTTLSELMVTGYQADLAVFRGRWSLRQVLEVVSESDYRGQFEWSLIDPNIGL